MPGRDRTETVEVPQLQCSDKVVDVLVEGRRGAQGHAATLGLATVKVPQTQFIAGVGGHSSSKLRRARFLRGMAAMRVFLACFGHFFALLQVVWS